MRVVLLAPLPPPTGGIASWTKRMLESTLKNEWKVSVVDEKLIGRRQKEGGGFRKSVISEISRSFRIWKNIKIQANKEKIDIVQACIPATDGAMLREIISSRISRNNGAKFITHFRCTIPNMIISKRSKVLLRLLLKSSDAVFCLNEQSVDYIKKIREDIKCFNIPNFINEDEMFERKEFSTKIRKIVYTGHINEEKGCNIIIEVAKEFPNIEFRLIGRIQMNLDGLPSNVVIMGEQDRKNVQNELKEADVFIFLSRYKGEGFSNSLAEAMAFSLPCIVSDWAANKDMIGEDGGIVLNECGVSGVMSAINRMDNKNDRERMARSNFRKATEKYRRDIVTEQYVDSYESIIK